MGTAKRLFLATYCSLAAALAANAAERFEFASDHMGTRFGLTLYCDTKPRAEAAAKDAFARVAAIEKVLTDYDPKSEAMQVCRRNDERPGVPIVISDDLYRCLKISLRVAELTQGKFDPTVGPLSKLWRLSRRTQQPSDPADLRAALAKVGYAKLKLDPNARTVTFSVPGVRLDFGGIGKGFAADEVRTLLRDKHKLESVLIAAGGDITCGDAPPGTRGWRVAIKPLAQGRPERRLVLATQSVSTSGDLDQVALIGGVRYSHVLDPTTGVGLTGRRSVTVVAPSGALADALTKAASVLPAAQALKLIVGVPGAELSATVVASEGAAEVVTESVGFSKLMAGCRQAQP